MTACARKWKVHSESVTLPGGAKEVTWELRKAWIDIQVVTVCSGAMGSHWGLWVAAVTVCLRKVSPGGKGRETEAEALENRWRMMRAGGDQEQDGTSGPPVSRSCPWLCQWAEESGWRSISAPTGQLPGSCSPGPVFIVLCRSLFSAT